MTNTMELLKHMELEIDLIEQLNEVLLEERTLLAKRQFDELENYANKKQDLSDRLEKSAQQRALLTGQASDEDAKSAFLKFLETCSEDDAKRINQLNNKLIETLSLCREYNSINGQVIATNMQSRKEIVETLSGSNQGSSANVYTATGEMKSVSNKSPIHKA